MCLNIVDDNGSDTHVLVEKVIKIKKRVHSLRELFSNYNINQNYKNIKKLSTQLYVHFRAGKILYFSNDTMLNLKL
tara:strand:+ start:222 stop:449 length:228 start_codon:yes stop_codon:yes gene_type:complete